MIMSDMMPVYRSSEDVSPKRMQKRAQSRRAEPYVRFVRGPWPPSSISR